MNIFDKMIPSAPSQRTAFDLDQRHIYSQKLGQDVPVLAIDMLPKDYAEIDVMSLVRTLPLNTSAYARMKARFQFIFVPYQQLWHGWNQYFLNTQENMSVGTSFDHDACPRTNFQLLLHKIFEDYANCRLTMLGCFDDVILGGEGTATDDQRLAWLGQNNAVDSMGYWVCENAVRLLDMLGYGGFDGVLKAISKIIDDNPNLQTTNPQPLLDIIDNSLQVYLTPYQNRMINLWRLLAYHKAWQDYFMNKRIQSYDPEYFNVDDKSLIDLANDNDLFYKLFTLHYHPWSYDMFTGLYNSPQDGDVSLVSGSGSFSLVSKHVTGSDDIPKIAGGSSNFPGALYNPNYTSNPLTAKWIQSPNTGISVYDIKRAEYLQNWKENKLRAGYKLQNQARAQWNARFKYLADEYSEYLGETIMNVSIDEVINTAQDQGDITGKGIGTTSGKIKFNTEDAGVLLCICSVTPTQEYNATMIDKQNTCIEPWDFPNPFFDRLGFEGVSVAQLNFLSINGGVGGDLNPDYILGYAPRYAAWKTAIDKVHGEFKSVGNASSVAKNDTNPNYIYYRMMLRATGSLSPWTMARNDVLAYSSTLANRVYYIAPDVANPIFGQVATSEQDSDHFLFNTNFAVRIVRQMSGLGLPSWNS